MKLAPLHQVILQHFPYSFAIPNALPNLVRCHHLACKDNRICRSRWRLPKLAGFHRPSLIAENEQPGKGFCSWENL
jgi:hypothetical protein